ncbi:c-type cytochrome domain-containing protein [Luteolibacter marinus]|uniref:c-type cytochrome domain-containing protein n=1 Tax=Luteolibacter marinus TaxID=2776705 RepID=UPI0018687127|nr:c-type cytochrome domain-containing protein [Luteolibacter marinus]
MTETDTPRRSLVGPLFLTIFGLLLIAAMAALFWVGPPPEDGLPDIAKFIGRFHPVILHLPIGMLLLVLVLETGKLFSRKKPSSSTQVAMFFAAASAVVAMLLGFVLYYSMPDYGKELAERHLNGGIIFACGMVAAFVVKVWVDYAAGRGAWFYWIMLVGSTVMMGIASHDGASLTHGEDYLTKYAPNEVRKLIGQPLKEETPSGGAAESVPVVAKPPSEQVVYQDVIVPILEEKCYSCHNVDKMKGKYRMDDYDLLVKGGKEGEAIEIGHSADSNMIFRIDLPEDDDEHMPPEGKKDLEEHEVVLIKWWIDGGASKDAKLADMEMPEPVKQAMSKLVPPEVLAQQKAAAEQAAKVDADKREAVKAEVDKLREQFPAALNFESQSSSGLTFTAVSMRKTFGDTELAKLGPVMPAMVSLDLSASTVTDQGAKVLEHAAELRSLRLSETAVTDASLETLSGLPKLESLNLYGTQVTNEGILKLASLSNLKKLYLWQTKVDDAGVQALKAKLPGCEIVMGL